MKMQLPENVSYIIHKLEEKGYEAFSVGGCVRDALLGREPEDWDITTSAKPMEIKSVFKKTIDTGIQHGTVTVMLDHIGYEVTTYRIDGEYEDNRHPKQVEFTTNLRMDLERRDFTINAMAYNNTVGLVDEFDGIGDLKNGIIRCVGDAGQRFDEDALRMLRAVRFSGQLGFRIEEKTRQAIRERAIHLENISAERIRVELSKLLISKDSGQIREAYRLGMTKIFMPELDNMMDVEQKNPHHIYTVGEHSIRAVEIMNFLMGRKAGDWDSSILPVEKLEKVSTYVKSLDKKSQLVLCLTMLLHDMAKPDVMQIDENGIGHFHGHPQEGEKKAEKILRRLTFDNETTRLVKRLIIYHDYRIEPSIRVVRRAVSKIGKDIMRLLFAVQYADVLAQNPDTYDEKLERIEMVWSLYEEIEQNEVPLEIKDLAVSGNDLIKMGVKPGPGLGELLTMLLEAVLEEPELNQKEKLIQLVNKEVSIEK